MPLSTKQIEVITECTHRFNILVGSVRSGKTHASTLVLADFIKNGVKGDCMIVGVNRSTIQRNVLSELYNFLGLPPPASKSMETKLYGRNIYFVGAHDESAVRAIQGSTLAFAYVDEITAIPAPFWKMLIGRLSIAGARLAGTCNPDGPYHWFKKEFIDRCADLDMVVWNFNLDDNPVLDPVYKENLKKEYTGMWYKRYILGEWAVAHGLIYDGFDQDNLYEHPFDNPIYYICGIDYGCSNPTAAIVCSVNPHKWPQIRTEDIYHYDSIKKGKSLTTDELADNIYQMLKYKNVRSVYVDPSAADLKLELRNRNLPVLDANNDVLEGIKVVSKFIARKNIVIQKGHTELIECLQTYSWDEKAANRGEDKPLKKNDHLADALRYAIYSEFPTGEIDRTGENMTIEQIREYVYGDDKINLYGSGPFG